MSLFLVLMRVFISPQCIFLCLCLRMRLCLSHKCEAGFRLNRFPCFYFRMVGTLNKSNSSTHMMHFPRAECVIWFTAMLILSLATVTLNIITVIAFVSNSQVRKRSTYILISLSVADMMVGAVTVPVDLSELGGFTCGLWKYEIPTWFYFFQNAVHALFPLASLSHLVAVSLERLYVTLCPFKYRSVKDKTYGIVIVIVWLIPTLAAIVHVIAFEFGSIRSYMFTWICYPPVVLVSICVIYLIILIKVRCSSLPRRHGAANRERNLTITLFTVTAVSLLAWIPRAVLVFAQHFREILFEISISTVMRMNMVTVILYQANSLVNPIVYTIRMPEFRKAASTLLYKKRGQRVEQIMVP